VQSNSKVSRNFSLGKGFILNLSSNSLPLAEETLIQKILEETNWNLRKAARNLEIARGTLYRKIKKHNIRRHPSSLSATPRQGRHKKGLRMRGNQQPAKPVGAQRKSR